MLIMGKTSIVGVPYVLLSMSMVSFRRFERRAALWPALATGRRNSEGAHAGALRIYSSSETMLPRLRTVYVAVLPTAATR